MKKLLTNVLLRLLRRRTNKLSGLGRMVAEWHARPQVDLMTPPGWIDWQRGRSAQLCDDLKFVIQVMGGIPLASRDVDGMPADRT